MDYDKFSNDDIAGHSFFNLSNVMGLREAVAGGFGNVPQQMLNIFHPKPGGQYFERKTPLVCFSVYTMVFWLWILMSFLRLGLKSEQTAEA